MDGWILLRSLVQLEHLAVLIIFDKSHPSATNMNSDLLESKALEDAFNKTTHPAQSTWVPFS